MTPVPLTGVDEDAVRVPRAAGKAGGPIEPLEETPPAAPRVGRVPTEETRELEGVPVREVVALAIGVVPSCFVGDLVGDY